MSTTAGSRRFKHVSGVVATFDAATIAPHLVLQQQSRPPLFTKEGQDLAAPAAGCERKVRHTRHRARAAAALHLLGLLNVALARIHKLQEQGRHASEP